MLRLFVSQYIVGEFDREGDIGVDRAVGEFVGGWLWVDGGGVVHYIGEVDGDSADEFYLVGSAFGY